MELNFEKVEEKFFTEDYFRFLDRKRSPVTMEKDQFTQIFGCSICYRLLDLKEREKNKTCFQCSQSFCNQCFEYLQNSQKCPHCKKRKSLVTQVPINWDIMNKMIFKCNKCKFNYSLSQLHKHLFFSESLCSRAKLFDCPLQDCGEKRISFDKLETHFIECHVFELEC